MKEFEWFEWFEWFGPSPIEPFNSGGYAGRRQLLPPKDHGYPASRTGLLGNRVAESAVHFLREGEAIAVLLREVEPKE